LIQDQDLATRTQIVCSWAKSYLPLFRTVHNTFAGLARQVWLQNTTTLPKILDFPSTPKNVERNDSYNFKFHDFTSSSAPSNLSTDVVIIGSGCGAGVVASRLTKAGLKVTVLEKSYHFSSAYFPMISTDEHLFENGGFTTSDDSSIYVKAGSTFGGGGTINWSASLQPLHHVRNEWSESSGLSQFTSPEFQSCLDYVCGRMSVAKSTDSASFTNIKHNAPNTILLEGARRLGLSTITVPQNTGGRNHECGYCSHGCASCVKQGPANLWFPEAAEHGAEFIQGCFVEKIVFSDEDNKTATGVLCTWTSPDRAVTRSITISAARVIVSAGTLQSPLVLTRSGLTNRHIGQNLKLHPVSGLFATYPTRINPWEGSILTSAVTSLTTSLPATPRNGPVIECLYSVPTAANIFLPFHYTHTTPQNPAAAAEDFKLTAAKWGYSTAFVCIQRDIGSGSVYQDPNDKRMVRINYSADKRDRSAILKAQLLGARIAFAMGATELDCLHPNVPRFYRDTSTSATDATNAEALEIWLQTVEKRGLLADPLPAVLGSAHQMSSNRMSASPEKGVVDGTGKVHGTTNVYVADASVLPSASGVNPMVSTMGLADWIARGIERENQSQIAGVKGNVNGTVDGNIHGVGQNGTV
jgi:choline dehydrogenase-like flavoprotein